MNPKIIDNPPKMWWSGDKRVEPYMPKINEALERNGLTGDAKTDCYNRAYEAVYKAIVDATAERDRYKEAFRKILSMSTAGGWIEFTLQKLYPDVLAKIKEG